MMTESGGRLGRLIPVVIAALLCGVALGGESPAGEASDGVAEFHLPPGVAAAFSATGELSLADVAAGTTLLSCDLASGSRSGRTDSETTLFHHVYAEGDACGHRGFSDCADDDGDGLVDEDRADGRDNDGDGLIDEDLAAVGDGMVVFDRSGGGSVRHVEAYHWDYPHIDNVVLLSLDASSRGVPSGASLLLSTRGGEWRRAVTDLRSHGASGGVQRDGELVVSRVEVEGRVHWLGVMALAADRVSPGGEDLRIRGGGRVELAVGTAPTLLQLRFAMSFVPDLREGAPASPGGESVPWIVPPLCPACRQVEALPASWREGAEGTWQLVLGASAAANAYVDPGAMIVGGRELGDPLTVAWIPAGDGGWSEELSGGAPGNADPEAGLRDPYLENSFNESDREDGELVFTFRGEGPAPGELLSCTFLCGRTIMGEISAPPIAAPVSADMIEREALEASGRQPMLSPSLLETFPNPFRDQTRIRFRVPETVGEGFVWADGAEPDVDLQARIPYSSSAPSVSLKVYTVAGHEIATIFNGSRSIGGYEAAWDGKDSLGRSVAAGTYFCKLQIENWSVTKRVTFLR